MKCIEVKENLDALLDDELDFSEKEVIASHLGKCASCQTEFEHLHLLGEKMKTVLPTITAPAVLDTKVFNAFEQHHAAKQNIRQAEKREKRGWFGIPIPAFAIGLLLLAITGGLAFQIGRISTGKAPDITSKMPENKFTQKDSAGDNFKKTSEIKYIEVPVIRERIVKVPVIKEKIVTRTVYVNKSAEKDLPDVLERESLALNNSVKDGEFLTQTNLKDFQPVSEIKPKIIKKEE